MGFGVAPFTVQGAKGFEVEGTRLPSPDASYSGSGPRVQGLEMRMFGLCLGVWLGVAPSPVASYSRLHLIVALCLVFYIFIFVCLGCLGFRVRSHEERRCLF